MLHARRSLRPVPSPGVACALLCLAVPATGTEATDPEPLPPAEPIPAPCPRLRRAGCRTTLDLGLHTSLTRGSTLAGGQVGLGLGLVALRGELGSVVHHGRVERFDTTALGWYWGLSGWAYLLRTPLVEARVGAGYLALHLSEIDVTLDYSAGFVGAATNLYFTPNLSAALRVDALPLRSGGLELGPVPLLAQLGLEASIW